MFFLQDTSANEKEGDPRLPGGGECLLNSRILAEAEKRAIDRTGWKKTWLWPYVPQGMKRISK